MAKKSHWRGKYRTLREYYELEFDNKYFSFDEYEMEIDPDETQEQIEAYSKDPNKVREETMKCAFSFTYWCHKYAKILHPKRGLIPFRLFNYQREVIDHFENNRFNIIRKFRQGGLTTVALLWALWKCLFQLDQQIMCVSKTDREATDVGQMIDRTYEILPSWMAPTKGEEGTWNAHTKSFPQTGGRIMFHSPEAARGKALTILIIDEAAFVPDMEDHWKALYPVLSTGGNCIAISTVNGLGNWYQKTYYDAQEGNNEFNIIDLKYKQHPDYNNEKWVETMKAQLGEDGWLQEVEGDFLGSGDTYIPAHLLEAISKRANNILPVRKLFSQWTNKDSVAEQNMKEKERKRCAELGLPEPNWDGDKGALWVFKEAIEGHEYIIGADVAAGAKRDCSCFQVIDLHTMEQVAEFYSNTVPPHIFSEILSLVGKMYFTALVVVENMSDGLTTNSLLQHNLFYENLYYEQATKKGQPKPGIKTGQANRPSILDALRRRILNNTIIINSRRLVKELNTFSFNKETGKVQAQKGHHDDAIFAMCFALYVRDSTTRDVPVGSDIPAEYSKHLTSVDFESIKEEILRGSPDDWLNQKDDVPSFLEEKDEKTPAVTFRRKYNTLLNEFGWTVFLTIWLGVNYIIA
jgi:hypothetical protein